MASPDKVLALGAFACVAGCLVTLALPSVVGGVLATSGWRAFGWEIVVGALIILSSAVAAVHLLRRKGACGC